MIDEEGYKELHSLFRKALLSIGEQGFINEYNEIAPGVYITPGGNFGWSSIARELSVILPGTFLPQVTRGGLVWQKGSITAGRLVFERNLKQIRLAQRLVRYLMGELDEHSIPWSIGGACNKCLRWSVAPQKWVPKSGKLLMNDQFGERDFQYHDCSPGAYKYVYQWDASGYYWNLISRLESPRVSIGSNPNRPVIFEPLETEEAAKWRELIDLTQPGDKGIGGSIYKSIWGSMLGSNPTQKQIIYSRGKLVKPYFRAGVLRAGAMLVSRMGSELCHLAALETDSLYSTVDSVTSLSPNRPVVWQAQGLPSRCKWEGEGDIRGRGCWRIGVNQTIPYKLGQGMEGNPVRRRDDLPNLLYFPSAIG